MFEKTAEVIPIIDSVELFEAYPGQIYWKIRKRAPKRYSRRGRWRILKGINMKMSEKITLKIGQKASLKKIPQEFLKVLKKYCVSLCFEQNSSSMTAYDRSSRFLVIPDGVKATLRKIG